MAKKAQKRRPGRPKGEPTETFPIRMPVRLLKLLRRDAEFRKPNYVTPVIIEILEQTYNEAPMTGHMRDLALFLEMCIRYCSHTVDKDGNQRVEWANDPFFFRAIKLAFNEILDSVAPEGDSSKPNGGDVIFEGTQSEIATFSSPEARAAAIVQIVMNRWRDVEKRRSVSYRHEQAHRLTQTRP